MIAIRLLLRYLSAPFRYYLEAWRRCLDFSTRSSRREFLLASIIPGILIKYVPLDFPESFSQLLTIKGGILLLLSFPNLALSIRRLHDIGLNGWLYLVTIIPYLEYLAVILLVFHRGEEKENEYGIPRKWSKLQCESMASEVKVMH